MKLEKMVILGKRKLHGMLESTTYAFYPFLTIDKNNIKIAKASIFIVGL